MATHAELKRRCKEGMAMMKRGMRSCEAAMRQMKSGEPTRTRRATRTRRRR